MSGSTLYLKTANVTIANTNTAQKVFPSISPKVTYISFKISTGTAYVGDSLVNAAGVPPVGTLVGTTEKEFYAQARHGIATDQLYVSGTAAAVLAVTYLEAK